MLRSCAEIEKLIPFDAAVGIFSTIDWRYLEGIGAPESVIASYNNYYRTRQPAYRPGDCQHQDHWGFLFGPTINWREHQDLAYAVDFMIPNGLSKTLARAFPGQPVTLSIQRSRWAQDFTGADVTMLDLLNQHLNNL